MNRGGIETVRYGSIQQFKCERALASSRHSLQLWMRGQRQGGRGGGPDGEGEGAFGSGAEGHAQSECEEEQAAGVCDVT